MTDTNQLLLLAAQGLELDDEIALFKALGAIWKKWDELGGEVAGATSLEALVTQIATDVNGDQIKAALAAAGLDGQFYDSLKGSLGQITDAFGKVPDKYKRLLDPLDSFAAGDAKAVVDWSATRSTKPATGSERYTIDLGADARIGFNAAGKWPGPGPAPARLLTLGAKGGLSVGGKGSVPFGLGALGIGGDAKARTALDYYFAAPNSLYALAVAERLDKLPNPFDLDAVWAAFAASDLEGVVIALEGTASARIDVKVADATTLAPGVAIDLGVTVGVTASLRTGYTLTLRRGPAPAGSAAGFSVQATLGRSKVDQSKVRADFTAQADISEVTKPVVAAMERALERWDAALNPVKPFLSPGTWLRKQADDRLAAALKPLIDDEKLRDAILADARTGLGLGQSDSSAVVGWLVGQFTAALDKASTVVTDRSDQAIDNAVEQLQAEVPVLARTGLDAELQASVDKLKALIADEVGKVRTAFEDRAKALYTGPANKLNQALKKAGDRIDAQVKSADDALKRVRDLLARYDTLFREIVAKTKEAAESKITLGVFAEETRLDQTVVELAGDFVALTPQARETFKDITRGRLEALATLFETQATPAGFVLHRDRSRLERASATSSSQGFQIVLLNIGRISFEELLSNKTKVVLNGFGNIDVDLEANLRKTLSIFNQTREASFLETTALAYSAAAADPAGDKRTIDIGVGARYADKKFTLKQVDQFVGHLVAAGLLGAEAAAAAAEAFKSLSKGAVSIDGDIAASLKLSDERLRALMRLDQRVDGKLPEEVRRKILGIGLEALRAHGAMTAQFARGAGVLQNFIDLKPKPTDLDLILRYREKLRKKGPGLEPSTSKAPDDGTKGVSTNPRYPGGGGGASDGSRDYYYFLNHAFAVEQLVALVDTLGDIYQSTPKAGQAGAGWDKDRYEEAQDILLQAARNWLGVLDNLVALNKATPTRVTTAFLRALVDLAEIERPGGLTLKLTNHATSETITVE